jgi:NADH:ubiquinone oxidoreductase subunit E
MSHFTGTKEEIKKKCEQVLTKEIVDFINGTLKEPHHESMLISVLHKVQEKFKFLTPEKLQAVAYLMNVPAAKVSGVATFYHYFHFKDQGKYVISICLGTACHVKGSDELVERFERELGIKLGETTIDKLFTLQGERCLGICALAPVIKIQDKVYSQVTPDQVPKILEEYLSKK